MRFLDTSGVCRVQIPARLDHECIENIVETDGIVILVLVFV